MTTIDRDDAVDNVLADLLKRFGKDARAEIVFGDAIQHEHVEVVPVAKASWGFGAGASGEAGPSQAVGAGVSVSPVGFIEITESGASFRRIRPWWVEVAYVFGSGLLALTLLRLAKR